MTGGCLTAIVIVTEQEPSALDALTLYPAAVEGAEGVQLKTPLVGFRTRPVGKGGETEKPVGVPPDTIGLDGEIGTPTTKSNSVNPYVMLIGACCCFSDGGCPQAITAIRLANSNRSRV